MSKIKERIFILVSCLELSIGLLQMCQNEIPFRRFILWGFLGIYAAVLVTNHYREGKDFVRRKPCHGHSPLSLHRD